MYNSTIEVYRQIIIDANSLVSRGNYDVRQIDHQQIRDMLKDNNHIKSVMITSNDRLVIAFR